MMRSQTGLALGALAGAVLAISALLWPEPPASAGMAAAAHVNGHAIPAEDVQLALDAIAADSRNPLAEDAYEHALSRLVDEELLFQRAIELDLPREASNLRRTIVLTMIDSIVQQARAEPEEAELEQFFQDNQALFEGEPLLLVSWRISETEAGERMRPTSHPPGRALTATDLRRYLGRQLTAVAQSLEPGTSAAPVERGGRYHWVTLIERTPAPEASFANQRDAVLALWQDREQERALAAYLANLRRQADIRYTAEAE